MKNSTQFTFLALLLLLSGCKKDKPTPLEDLPYGQYLKTINDLATQHGMDIEKKLRKLKFERIEGFAEGTSCGNEVILVPTLYENIYGEDFTGQFIYHQIGHCVLGRQHRNDKFANDEWKSLMRQSPYLGAEGQACDFTGSKKEYYLEELFNEQADPAGFDFSTAPIPFDDNLQRHFERKLECNTNYYDLIAEDVNFDIEIKYTFTSTPSQIQVSLFDGNGFYLRLWQQGQNRTLVIDDIEYGLYFAFEAFDFPNYDQGFTLTLRRIGDKFLFYINKQYMYARSSPPFGIDSILATGNPSPDCGPEIKIFTL